MDDSRNPPLMSSSSSPRDSDDDDHHFSNTTADEPRLSAQPSDGLPPLVVATTAPRERRMFSTRASSGLPSLEVVTPPAHYEPTTMASSSPNNDNSLLEEKQRIADGRVRASGHSRAEEPNPKTPPNDSAAGSSRRRRRTRRDEQQQQSVLEQKQRYQGRQNRPSSTGHSQENNNNNSFEDSSRDRNPNQSQTSTILADKFRVSEYSRRRERQKQSDANQPPTGHVLPLKTSANTTADPTTPDKYKPLSSSSLMRPGAFAAGDRSKSSISYNSDRDYPPTAPNKPHDDEVIVEAKLVDSVRPLPVEAQVVATATRDSWCRRHLVCLTIAALAIVTSVIALAVYFGLTAGTNQSTPDPEEEQPPVPVVPSVANTTEEAALLALIQEADSTSDELLSDPSTPQSQAFVWVSSREDFRAVDNSTLLERYGLATLLYATGAVDTWQGDATAGFNNTRICEWPRVECDDNRTFFREVDLSGLALTGSIAAEIELLSNLEILDLSTNALISTIPTNLAKLTALQHLLLGDNPTLDPDSIGSEIVLLTSLKHLDLSNSRRVGEVPPSLLALTELTSLAVRENGLSGELPNDLALLAQLEMLDLAHNRFEGTVPDGVPSLTVLRYLNISGNSFEGDVASAFSPRMQRLEILDVASNRFTVNSFAIEKVNFLSNLQHLDLRGIQFDTGLFPDLALTKLTHLDLGGCSLQGLISPMLGNLTDLIELDMHANALSGSLPEELFGLVKLRSIRMNSNQLEGSISSLIGRMTGLASLDVSDNDFGGPLPLELYSLHELSSLVLRSNTFSGSIDSSIGNLSHMKELDLAFNGLLSIPSEIGLLTKLTLLDVEENFILGEFPSEVAACTALQTLNLRNNLIFGPLHDGYGGLTALSALILGLNSADGEIPASYYNLTNLVEIDFESLGLSGSLPANVGQLSNVRSIVLDNNGLSRPLPTEIGQLVSLETLDLSRNDLTGTIPMEIGNLTMVSALDLQGNLLSGSVPRELGNLIRLFRLRLHLNSVTGSIPERMCDFASIVVVDCHLVSCGCCGCPDPTAAPAFTPAAAPVTSSPVALPSFSMPVVPPPPVGLDISPNMVPSINAPTLLPSSFPTLGLVEPPQPPFPSNFIPVPGTAKVVVPPPQDFPVAFLPPIPVPVSEPNIIGPPIVASDPPQPSVSLSPSEFPTSSPSLPFCFLNLTSSCVPSDGSAASCDGLAPIRTECTDRPFAMEFIFTGGSCGSSMTNQTDLLFQCQDYGPLLTPIAYVVVSDAQTGVELFAGFVFVGDTYALNIGERDTLGLMTNITTYSAENTTVMLQSLVFFSACSRSNLFLGDQFGGHQIREFENEDQGYVTARSEVNLTFAVTFPELDNVAESLEVVSWDVTEETMSLAFGLVILLEAGQVLARGDTIVTSLLLEVDLLVGGVHQYSSAVSGLSSNGGDCDASSVLAVSVGGKVA